MNAMQALSAVVVLVAVLIPTHTMAIEWIPLVLLPEGECADSSTPAQATLVSAEVVARGRGPRVLDDGTRVVSSWDGDGAIELVMLLGSDNGEDRTLGYEFEVIGSAPDNLRIPAIPMVPVNVHDIGELDGSPRTRAVWYFLWPDGRTDAQEPIAFELRARAVDACGNVSEWSESVIIADEGRTVPEP